MCKYMTSSPYIQGDMPAAGVAHHVQVQCAAALSHAAQSAEEATPTPDTASDPGWTQAACMSQWQRHLAISIQIRLIILVHKLHLTP
jgi:hypothetical protein